MANPNTRIVCGGQNPHRKFIHLGPKPIYGKFRYNTKNSQCEKRGYYQFRFNCFINGKRFTSLDKRALKNGCFRMAKTLPWLCGISYLIPRKTKSTDDGEKKTTWRKKRLSKVLCFSPIVSHKVNISLPAAPHANIEHVWSRRKSKFKHSEKRK